MRLWSLHPRYLDRLGLLGLWREVIVAKRLLFGELVTPAAKRYFKHPQLERFKCFKAWETRVLIVMYAKAIYDEGIRRGYKFNLEYITNSSIGHTLPIMKYYPNLKVDATTGQLEFELSLLKQKTWSRDRVWLFKNLLPLYHKIPEPNPMIRIIWGSKQNWEKSTLDETQGDLIQKASKEVKVA